MNWSKTLEDEDLSQVTRLGIKAQILDAKQMMEALLVMEQRLGRQSGNDGVDSEFDFEKAREEILARIVQRLNERRNP